MARSKVLKRTYRIMVLLAFLISIVNFVLTSVKIIFFERETMDYLFLLFWALFLALFAIVIKKFVKQAR